MVMICKWSVRFFFILVGTEISVNKHLILHQSNCMLHNIIMIKSFVIVNCDELMSFSIQECKNSLKIQHIVLNIVLSLMCIHFAEYFHHARKTDL